MKGSLIIYSAIVLILVFAVRASFKINTDLEDEQLSYVKNLKYVFTAKIDSVVANERGNGYFLCGETKGILNKTIEDSLNTHLINYKRMRFLHFRPNGKFQVFSGKANAYFPGDSISINSNKDQILIFRDDSLFSKLNISNSMRYKVRFAFWLRD